MLSFVTPDALQANGPLEQRELAALVGVGVGPVGVAVGVGDGSLVSTVNRRVALPTLPASSVAPTSKA